MPDDFDHDPPVPDRPAPLFRQTVRSATASATWQPLAGVDGAYQLVWAEVTAGRRIGGGSAVLREAMRQASLHGGRVGAPLRRIIALVPQPLVIARAWLLKNGFVHVHTLEELARDGETLVMMRTFD